MHRFEDERLLRGVGRYVEDLGSAECLHAMFVRSPHAHVRMAHFDTRAATASDGVRAAFRGRDFLAQGVQPLICARQIESSDGTPFYAPTRNVLAVEKVRFVGDPVAMVVATSIEAAADAADQVEIDYEPLPVVLDPRESDEVAVTRKIGDPEATAAAFARAAHVVRIEHTNNRICAAPVETRSAIGRFDAEHGTYRLDTQSQGGHLIRTLIAASLGIDEGRLRVVTPEVGGSFGMKLVSYPEQSAVLLAARMLGAPVRWVSTRAEASLTDTHARGHQSVAELALDAEGRILALRCVTDGNMGAYASAMATASPVIGFGRSLPNLYRIPALDLTMRAAYTHTAPVDALRGAGKPEGVYVMERLMDAAARETGIDRMALRERNLVTPPRDALPGSERRALGLRRLPGRHAHRASRGGLGHFHLAPGGQPRRRPPARIRPRPLPAHRGRRHRRDLRGGSQRPGPTRRVRRTASDRARTRDDFPFAPLPPSRRAGDCGRAGAGRHQPPAGTRCGHRRIGIAAMLGNHLAPRRRPTRGQAEAPRRTRPRGCK